MRLSSLVLHEFEPFSLSLENSAHTPVSGCAGSVRGSGTSPREPTSDARGCCASACQSSNDGISAQWRGLLAINGRYAGSNERKKAGGVRWEFA
jgi:hypothetical protein